MNYDIVYLSRYIKEIIGYLVQNTRTIVDLKIENVLMPDFLEFEKWENNHIISSFEKENKRLIKELEEVNLILKSQNIIDSNIGFSPSSENECIEIKKDEDDESSLVPPEELADREVFEDYFKRIKAFLRNNAQKIIELKANSIFLTDAVKDECQKSISELEAKSEQFLKKIEQINNKNHE